MLDREMSEVHVRAYMQLHIAYNNRSAIPTQIIFLNVLKLRCMHTLRKKIY